MKACSLLLLACIVGCAFSFKSSYAASTCPSDLAQTILESSKDLSEEVRRSKFIDMSASAFTFFRATNASFWRCFSNDERINKNYASTRTLTWIQGDLHPDNFGFMKSEEGNLVYTINDFDESVIADFKFDLIRMMAALYVYDEQLLKSLDGKLKKAFIGSYMDGLSDHKRPWWRFADWMDNEVIAKKADKLKSRLPTELREKLYEKYLVMEEGRYVFDRQGSFKELGKKDKEKFEKSWKNYQIKRLALRYQLKLKDVAIRLNAGLGSRGVKRYYVLVEGITDEAKDDIILDVKEQPKPSPLLYSNSVIKQRYETFFSNQHGYRHEFSFLSFLGRADPYLGWLEIDGKSFSVREKHPVAEKIKLKKLSYKEIIEMAEVWGQALAKAHLRASVYAGTSGNPEDFSSAVLNFYRSDKKGFQSSVTMLAAEYAVYVRTQWQNFKNVARL